MPWQELTLRVAKQQSVDVEDLLERLGAIAITLRDADGSSLFEPAPGEMPLWNVVSITALFDEDADVQMVLAQLPEGVHGQTGHLADRVWEREWLENFKPMQFGRRLWIYPTWSEVTEADSIVLRLDPGLAFGSGTHETTRLCLEWLDGQLLDNQTLLDYGCGSGVLSIAAILLGCDKVVAVDIDEQARLATQRNADQNNIGGAHLLICSPESIPDMKFDVVVSNILSEVIMKLSKALVGFVEDGGRLVVSGILCHQQAAVLESFGSNMIWGGASRLGDWVCLHGVKADE